MFSFCLLLLQIVSLISPLVSPEKIFPLSIKEKDFLAPKNESTSKFFLILQKDWFLQSSYLVQASGEIISSPRFKPRGWIKTEVPTTVLAALVRQGIYPEPSIGLNNMKIPDANEDYSRKYNLEQYSHLPGKRNPWQEPYWFWTQFKLPESLQGRHIWLWLKGINYRAEVWLNGQLIADQTKIVGMFGHWNFDVSKHIFFDKKNTLAIKIYPLDCPGLPAEPQLRTFGPFGDNGGPTGDIGKNVTMQCSIGWDWIPEVRDRNMGIWLPILLTSTGPVDIQYPFVITKLTSPQRTQGEEINSQAELTIKVSLHNLKEFRVKGLLRARIRPANFSYPDKSGVSGQRENFYKESKGQPDELASLKKEKITKNIRFEEKVSLAEIILDKEVELAPLESQEIVLEKEEFPQLILKQPQLWWPAELGFPHLYELELSFQAEEEISDRETIRFGIREIKTQVTKIDGWPRRDFFINGHRLFLRGGAWVPEMLLRCEANPDWLLKELLLWREANLNLVRLWGGGVTPADEFFDFCDELGLLVWHDFWITGDCQATWGKGSRDWPLEADVFLANARQTVLRLRHHPSLFLWTAGNEGYPRKEIYQPLRNEILAKLDGTRPFLPSSGYTEPPEDWGLSWPDNQPSGSYSGGAYWWVNPKEYYQLVDKGRDWLFKNEVGLPSLPLLPSLKKFLPDLKPSPDLPFPLNHTWGFHDACEGNGKYSLYDKALRQRYGEPQSLEDYVWKAQLINAESYRAIFEATNQALGQVSGVILWKTNSAWPSVMWQLYDYYLRPNAAYYFVRRACEPLHPQLDLRDLSCWIINQNPEKRSNLLLQAELFNLEGEKIWSRQEKLEVFGQSKKKLWFVELPPVKFSQPSFCLLRLYSLISEEKEKDSHLDRNFFLRTNLVEGRSLLKIKDPFSQSPFIEPANYRLIQDHPKAKLIAENYYWLSPEDDFRALQNLPRIKIQAEMKEITSSFEQAEFDSKFNQAEKIGIWKISLHNPTKNLAFFVHLALVDDKGNEILPSFWDDNFFLLPPAESKEIYVKALISTLKRQKVRCRLEGYNLIPLEISPPKNNSN